MIKVFVHPPYFPDTGPLEVTLPIPDSKYKQCISELQRNNMGDEIEYDCYVDKIESDSAVLQRLVGSCVNIEELDLASSVLR